MTFLLMVNLNNVNFLLRSGESDNTVVRRAIGFSAIFVGPVSWREGQYRFFWNLDARPRPLFNKIAANCSCAQLFACPVTVIFPLSSACHYFRSAIERQH